MHDEVAYVFMAETQVGTDFMVGEAEAGSHLVAADPAPLGAVLNSSQGHVGFFPKGAEIEDNFDGGKDWVRARMTAATMSYCLPFNTVLLISAVDQEEHGTHGGCWVGR